MRRPPWWKAQKKAYYRAIELSDEGVPLLMEMGTGKTRVAVKWLEYLFRERDVRLVFVAAPLAAMHVWIENWHEWANAPVAFIDLHDTGSAGIREAIRLSNQGWPVICLVNYESAWFIGKKRVKIEIDDVVRTRIKTVDTTMADVMWDVGILDESTAIKTPGSKVTKFFRGMIKPRTKFRAILTGSAYIKRPIDVYAQIKFCCSRPIFPGDFAAFKAKYTIPHPMIPQAILGYQNLDDFVERLASCAILLKKEDVVDLPPFVHETRKVSLSAKSRKVYDEVTQDNYAYLEQLEADGVEITASHVFAVQRKQMQITSGFVYPDLVQVGEGDDAKMVKPAPIRLGTEKVSMLLDIMENRDYPTIIVVQMDEEERIVSETLEKRFGFTPKILNGRVKGAAARHNMIREARNDLGFIVKESVGAKGVDMRAFDMTIFYSHSFDTEDYDQMMSRNHRGGQTKNITYVHLLIKNTVDMHVMKSLKSDISLARQIERDWRELIRC
jgi:chromodomain-helicase-DNA-binding protein 1